VQVVTRGLPIVFLALAAARVDAQNADPAFLGQWTWSAETLASEGTGLGGAFVATVRGSEALFWNPAALSFDSGLDVRTSMGSRPGLGVVHHGEKWHVGFGVRRTFSRRERGQGFDPVNGVFEVGQLVVMLDQAAIGAGLRVSRLRLGTTLLAGPLKVDGAWSRMDATGEARYDYTGLGEWQVGFASGAILELLGTHPMARDQARLGVAVQWPTALRAGRYRRSELLLPAFEGTGPDLQRFRRPLTVSLGGEARLSMFPMFRSVRVAVGADWTDYASVLDAARDNGVGPATPLFFDDNRAWVFGGGVEAVVTMMRVRVGVREGPGHRLATVPLETGANNPMATFGASHDTVVAGKRLQFDVDSTSTFDDVVLSMRILW
jgi:hypothetical protein